jgi:hypothetical protein
MNPDVEAEAGPDEGRPVWTTLNVDAYQFVLAYDTARTAIAGWEDTKAKAKHAIAETLGVANRGMFSGKHVVTLSTSRPRRFNRAAFAEDHPDLYERYLEPASEPETRLWVPRRTLLPALMRPREEEP